MTEHIFIIGASNESLNAAIAMASIDKPVTLISPSYQIEDTLTHYRFERQMVSLWDLYIKEQKILLREAIAETLRDLTQDMAFSHATYWFFLDTLPAEVFNNVLLYFNRPHYKVILSGMCEIGEASRIADKLATSHVFYFPFIFMKDGMNFSSLINPDFLLLGEKTPKNYLDCEAISFFVNRSERNHITDIKTAEFARNTIMTMLATRLSFMNELARLADALQVDITQVQKIISKDARIGKEYISAGWGFGGKALPNELTLLTHAFKSVDIKSSLVQTVIDINEDQKELIFRKFWQHFDGFIENKTVVIWGAGYRKGTGRTINSAIHPLLRLLWSYDIKTLVYATNTAFELNELYSHHPFFQVIDDPYETLNQADALFILNNSFNHKPNIEQLNKVALPIFDAKNFISNQDKSKLVGKYYGIGR